MKCERCLDLCLTTFVTFLSMFFPSHIETQERASESACAFRVISVEEILISPEVTYARFE